MTAPAGPVRATPEYLAEVERQWWETYAARAIDGADPHYRRWLAENIPLMIERGEPIPPAAMRWVAFVLRDLFERESKALDSPTPPKRKQFIPTRHPGHPADEGRQVARRVAVAEAYLRIERDTPGLSYPMMNEAIAQRLSRQGGAVVMGHDRVKQIREAPGFDREVALVREFLDRSGWPVI